MPTFDMLVMFVVILLVASLSRMRPVKGGLVERLKREFQEAIRSAQGIPTPGGMVQTPPRPPVQRARPPEPQQAQPAQLQSIDWHGLEGQTQQRSVEVVEAPISKPHNPLPQVSSNPLVQAVVLAEVLANPRGALRKRR